MKARLYVESLAQHDFILAIDADEALTVELQQSILQLKKNWVKSGYYVARKTNYCGKRCSHIVRKLRYEIILQSV